MKSKLIGKMAVITDKESFYCGEWGIIDSFDGDWYYIKIAGGTAGQPDPVFDRDQFKVPMKQSERMNHHGN